MACSFMLMQTQNNEKAFKCTGREEKEEREGGRERSEIVLNDLDSFFREYRIFYCYFYSSHLHTLYSNVLFSYVYIHSQRLVLLPHS